MTREEFDTTKWYKGIKVRELESQMVFEVDGVDFGWRSVSFWNGKSPRALNCELIEIVKDFLTDEMEMNRNKPDTFLDWVLCAVLVICLVMMGFSAGCGDYLVAFCFATGLVNAVLLMTIREEVRDESKGI